MMTLWELLNEKKGAIIKRWLDASLATYSEDAAAAFSRQKDPFANPVGHSLREGTQGIYEALLKGEGTEGIQTFLNEIIRIRAVQQFAPSQALGFIFLLKAAAWAELGESIKDARSMSEWAEFEGRIDQLMMIAFDVFVQCREQVYELRVNELKRRVSWVVDKLNQREVDPELAEVNLE